MIIGTKIWDCNDFVQYIRDRKEMADQIKEWSDEDLEAFYLNVYDCYADDETVEADDIWDAIRFEFCVYKNGTNDEMLDIKDFVLDFYTELHDMTGLEVDELLEKFEDKNELDEIVFEMDQNYCMMFTSANGDVIVGR